MARQRRDDENARLLELACDVSGFTEMQHGAERRDEGWLFAHRHVFPADAHMIDAERRTRVGETCARHHFEGGGEMTQGG